MRILVADDDILARKLTSRMLGEEGFEVVLASDGQQAWEALSQPDAPQLALLDWLMPHMDGTEICRRVRERGGERMTYLVLVTAKTDATDLVAGLEAGADDYLKKPFNPLELKIRLHNAKRLIQLQNELIGSREAFRQQAQEDHLTRVWNRRRLREHLEVEAQRSARTGTPVSVVMLDVDHFKRVNDTYGHAAGDRVLCEVARRIRGEIRPYDGVGRYGGEEFAVVLPACDLEAGTRAAERIRRVLADEPVEGPDGPIPVSASLGVATSRFDRGEGIDEVIARADTALYAAKRAGRNRVCCEEQPWKIGIERATRATASRG